MEYILKKDGYVYLVRGDKGFETFYNMGKDPEDDRWAEDLKPKKKKRNRTKKEEDI